MEEEDRAILERAHHLRHPTPVTNERARDIRAGSQSAEEELRAARETNTYLQQGREHIQQEIERIRKKRVRILLEWECIRQERECLQRELESVGERIRRLQLERGG